MIKSSDIKVLDVISKSVPGSIDEFGKVTIAKDMLNKSSSLEIDEDEIYEGEVLTDEGYGNEEELEGDEMEL